MDLENRRRAWFGVLLALLTASGLPTGATAQELQLGADLQYVYNSNFFSSAGNEDEAHSITFGPRIELVEDDGRWQYELAFQGAYQAYVDQDGVDAWESRLRGRLTWVIDARTRLRATNRFRDISNLRFSRQDIALADTALDPNQDRYLRNDFELEGLRDLTRFLELRVRGGHRWIEFTDDIDRNDSQAWLTGAELLYRVAARHRVGAGLDYVRQDFQQASVRLGSLADSVNGYVSWIWEVNDRITFSANGGPSWIRSDEDGTRFVTETARVGGRVNGEARLAPLASCDVDPVRGVPVASNCDLATGPVIRGGAGPRQNFLLADGDRVGTASEITFFGGAAVEASFDDWNLLANYNRRQSTTSGDGLASSLDRIFLEAEWAPRSLRFSTFVAGSWDRRETLTEATFVDYEVIGFATPDGVAAARDLAFTGVDQRRSRRDNFTAVIGVRSRLDRRLSNVVEFRYRRTQGRSRAQTLPDIDTYFVVLTFAYDHDPISF